MPNTTSVGWVTHFFFLNFLDGGTTMWVEGIPCSPANVKPHVVAAMLNMETPIDGTEQGQTQVCTKVIVHRRVILHHVVAK